MSALDRRLNAFRPDLADARLRGRVEASRFVDSLPARVSVAVADLRPRPEPDCGLDTQLLCGETVRVFEQREGWAWVQADRDHYVGYTASAALEPAGTAPTHRVRAARSFTYRGPDLKLPATGCHTMGAELAVADFRRARGNSYAMLATGEALFADHLRPLAETEGDFVAAAEKLEHTPYLWGGRSAFGIDCSGFVQLAFHMAGKPVLRDTDMQAVSIGTPVDPEADLRRGDLIFWEGHVAIMTDGKNLIHANGHTMSVSREPLARAVERIAPVYGRPTGLRRP